MVRPLDKIEAVGERGENQSFPIRRHKGRYLYIRTGDFEQLRKINEAYKSIYEAGVEPLWSIKIVGRGGVAGYRPFLLRGYEDRYLCILEEHLRQLGEINAAYGEFLEVEKRKEEGREKLEEKRKRTEKGLADVEVLIEDVKAADALRYVPEMMEEMEKAFADARNAFDAAEYDRAFKLLPRIKGLAEQVKTETLNGVKEKRPEEGKYVYGIVPFADEKISFGNVGIENNGNVYAINYKDVAAVVSDASVKDYILAEDYIRTHDDVIRAVSKDYSVVPAAFGQVFKNQKILRTVMRTAYKKLRECLKLVDDRVELGVKVILPKQVAESLDEQKRESFRKNGEEIFALLNRKAENSVKGRLFSDRLTLNASFLVDKENIEEFSEEVGKLSEEYGDLKIKYSGPWPPYSFVTVRIGPEGVKVGRREVT